MKAEKTYPSQSNTNARATAQSAWLARLIRSTVLLLALTAILPAQELTFERHVRPILKAQCFHCHGEDRELHGNLDVRLVRLMTVGGDSGAAIEPGSAEASLLWQRIDSDEMPEGDKKLTAVQKRIIRDWIDTGAKTLRVEPQDVRDARFSHEELSHWAFQPIANPAVPAPEGYELNTPIDGFIARQLAAHELEFSPVASRRTLIRRVFFNLLGLPPTPEDVVRFVNDPAPDAYEQLVDRLIASPQFGVRWGRHWLDVAGYSETNGLQVSDGERPHIWRYRDWVIDAFNQNKPIDQFIVEQLAGDELIDGSINPGNEQHLEWLTATGFLRLAPDGTKTRRSLEDRNTAVAEAIKVISASMLGLTVGCAQCHDHKYDPIGIDDYYRFRAVFDPLFPLNNWRLPGTQEIDFSTQDIIAEEARVEAQAKALEDDIRRRREEHAQKIQDLKLADVPEADRKATRLAVLTTPGKRTERQVALLKTYPMVKPIGTIAGGLLVEYDSVAYRKFEKELEKVAALRESKPARRIVTVNREEPGQVPESHVFYRGNPESRGVSVRPEEIMVLRRSRDVTLPPDARERSTGRRLSYARQLVDGTHPLSSRVFVNRVWLHHFGRGLVSTPGDFGISGERPTHPELLDWLATDFVEHGWDQKRLHRLILLSRTFQQVSGRSNLLNELDPENTLYARANLRRLEAEAIRDAILYVAGELNDTLGGKSLPVVEAPDGKVVLGRAKLKDGLKTGVNSTGAASRRSAYIQVQRRLPLNMLATFDQPDMNPSCQLRRPTTVATQSLWFLNDPKIVDISNRLASLALGNEKPADQLKSVFEQLFGSEPTESELSDCLKFLNKQTQQFATRNNGDNDPGKLAMASLCQALLASNRFLYVE